MSIVALIVVTGCGGGSSNKSAQPPTSSTSSGSGGVVSAESTKGFLGPAIEVVNGKVSIIAKGGPLSPKDNRPTPAQQHGVAGSGACAATAASPTRSNLRRVSSAILCLLNAERRSKGLPSLRSNGKLAVAARGWANRMVSGRFFAHEAAGSTLRTRVKRTGYIRGNWSLGENIAWGSGGLATPRAIVNGWMNSPGHRANILYGKFRDIGIGIRLGAPGANLSGGATYVTDFGRHG
jgi:uncharacterized protein YkwD